MQTSQSRKGTKNKHPDTVKGAASVESSGDRGYKSYSRDLLNAVGSRNILRSLNRVSDLGGEDSARQVADSIKALMSVEKIRKNVLLDEFKFVGCNDVQPVQYSQWTKFYNKAYFHSSPYGLPIPRRHYSVLKQPIANPIGSVDYKEMKYKHGGFGIILDPPYEIKSNTPLSMHMSAIGYGSNIDQRSGREVYVERLDISGYAVNKTNTVGTSNITLRILAFYSTNTKPFSLPTSSDQVSYFLTDAKSIPVNAMSVVNPQYERSVTVLCDYMHTFDPIDDEKTSDGCSGMNQVVFSSSIPVGTVVKYSGDADTSVSYGGVILLFIVNGGTIHLRTHNVIRFFDRN